MNVYARLLESGVRDISDTLGKHDLIPDQISFLHM